MKKLFLCVAIACFSLVANAQWWAGGTIYLNSTKSDASSSKTNLFQLSPTVGYNLNDQMSVGGSFVYMRTKAGDLDPNKSWAIEPFFRYNFFEIGDFSLFADAKISFGKDVADQTNIEFGIYPGLAYAINDKLGMTIGLGSLAYSKLVDVSSTFQFSANSQQLPFSIYYNF